MRKDRENMRILLMSVTGAILTLSASNYLAAWFCGNTWEAIILAPFIGVLLLTAWVFVMVKVDMYFNAE